jgi:formamidopyrimidine-DNA glycosylase
VGRSSPLGYAPRVAERPDLEYAVPILAHELEGQTIVGLRVEKPVVLRVVMRGAPEELLVGEVIRTVTRRAHFVLIGLDGARALEIAVAPMLAGRFLVSEASAKSPHDLAVALVLASGKELRYRDDVQMGKVYVIEAGAWDGVPGLAHVGVDVLDPKVFTRDKFRELARKRRDQAKVFLMDKSALDAMGNAYGDEVLFEARIHPKAMVRKLSDADLDRLHDAIVTVLDNARRVITERAPATDVKLRDFLKVRGHKGEPCARCGARLRSAGVHGHDAIFCPECQPDHRGTGIVDWRKTSK